MKLSHQWLREWVSPKLDVRALGKRLTSAGLEVASIAPAAPPLEHVVVARVRSKSPHPSAANLVICEVEAARGQTLRVVCGAPNAVVGMKAALALPGAILPGDRAIGISMIQGVESAGMLCSAAELGLGEDASGLLVLDPTARVGVTLADALRLDDEILEIELTPNRGDCLSVLGVAREVSALTGARLVVPPARKVPVKGRLRVAVKLLAKNECPRYVGRVVQGINPEAVTPVWMRERLRRAGVRSLHPVVDVTNYVMLELGQPMHGFDLDKLQGAVQVRLAGKNESLTLLDGKALTAPQGSLVIADSRGPIALAGVMGGMDTAVEQGTRNVFLESAFFAPAAIAPHARALGMQTESSQRFERGVDPELQARALERATRLLLEIAGGRAGPITEVTGKRAGTSTVLLRRTRLERVVGYALPTPKVVGALSGLGMNVRKVADGWRVAPPSYRFDVRIEADLIEEVVRIVGYANLPTRLPAVRLMAPEVSESRLPLRRLCALLVDRDYQEVITYSFIDPELQQALDPGRPALALANPISEDMAVMRTTLWPGLLQVLRYNRNRQQARIRVFEAGRRFLPGPSGLVEEPVLAGAVMGSATDKQWGVAQRPIDFYDVKGDMEALAALTGEGENFRFTPAAHSALHPGQTAAIHLGEEQIGWMGALHPALQTQLELDPVVLFELRSSALTHRRVPVFTDISRFPAIRRDLAIVVSEATAARQVADIIRGVAGNLLANLQLFDVYRGEGIDSGRKSLALGLTLQHSSRTLREAEVDTLMTQVISALTEEVGAKLRN